MKKFVVVLPKFMPFVTFAFIAGCVAATSPQSVSLGATPGKTAVETLASMKPEALTPMFSRYAKPDAPRNANGEVELFIGAAESDTIATVKMAGANICKSIGMALVNVKELPRDKNGVRSNQINCK